MATARPKPKPAARPAPPPTPAAPPKVGATTGVSMTASQGNALAALKNSLDDYGLGSLATWAYNEIIKGRTDSEVLRDIRETPEFKTRFPAIKMRQDAGLPALSPGEYVAYERSATELMRAAGLPKGFYDSPQDFTSLLANDVSPHELETRISEAKNATYNIPPEAQQRLSSIWGIHPGSGALAAYFLDPTKAEPLLTRDFEAARLGGQADKAGYGLSNAQAQALAQQGVNVDRLSGNEFSTLAKDQQLFGALPGEGTQQIGQDQQLAAMFGGNALAQQAIEQRTQQRKAEFAGDVGFATTSKGAVGLGSAQQV